MKLPLASKLKLLWKYGLRDYHAAVEMYEMIFNDDYDEWKTQDWRNWLDIHRFNSTDPKAIAFYTAHPWLKIKDTSWKACKKQGMSKGVWKACMLKSTPDECPSCLSFKNSYHYENHLICVFPQAILKHYWKNKIRDHISSFASSDAYTLAIKFDVEYADTMMSSDECAFAIVLFEIYINSLAHEYNNMINFNKKFFDYGIKLDSCRNFIEALKLSSTFDHMLKSKKMHSMLRVLCKWYRNRHELARAFAVLAMYPSLTYPNSKSIFNREKSYKADEAYDEIMRAIKDVLRFKRNKKLKNGEEHGDKQ